MVSKFIHDYYHVVEYHDADESDCYESNYFAVIGIIDETTEADHRAE